MTQVFSANAFNKIIKDLFSLSLSEDIIHRKQWMKLILILRENYGLNYLRPDKCYRINTEKKLKTKILKIFINDTRRLTFYTGITWNLKKYCTRTLFEKKIQMYMIEWIYVLLFLEYSYYVSLAALQHTGKIFAKKSPHPKRYIY